jgi:hypothetical protein
LFHSSIETSLDVQRFGDYELLVSKVDAGCWIQRSWKYSWEDLLKSHMLGHFGGNERSTQFARIKPVEPDSQDATGSDLHSWIPSLTIWAFH